MSGLVIAAVLLGAVLHAVWNALIKAQPDKFSAAALVAMGAGITAIPIAAFVPLPDSAAWPFVFASAAIHVGYFALVGYAYRIADLGVAYPLTRGAAPPLTALFAFLLIGETLGLDGWLAVAAIAAGITGLSADALLRGGLTRATAAAALLNAGVVVIYTLVDGLGARAAGNAVSYVTWMLALTATLVVGLMILTRGPRAAARLFRHWRLALGAGALSLASYGIALWAMTLAPIGLVAALRETSVLFAAILGAMLFGEPFGPRRWIAIALIVGGIAALRLL